MPLFLKGPSYVLGAIENFVFTVIKRAYNSVYFILFTLYYVLAAIDNFVIVAIKRAYKMINFFFLTKYSVYSEQ